MPAESGIALVTETAAHEHEHVRPTKDNAHYKCGLKTAELAAVDKERDDEMTEFLDTVPLSKRADKKYVKEHYGRVSDRRTASGAYSNDKDGRFTYRGKAINNGGYVRGRLRDMEKEIREFGPGEPWPGEEWKEAVSEDEDRDRWPQGIEPGPSEEERTRYQSLFDEDEFEKAKVMPDPGEPSEKEIEEHVVDHVPYRSWCSHCARGRGVGKPHRERKDEQDIPVFGLDYL